MLFTVFPLKAVNQIEFGMTAEIVREKMSGRLATGDIRARSKDHPTDYYQDEGAFFYYDEEGFLDAVEFASGANVILGGVRPLELPVGQAIAAMSKLDPNMIVDDEGAFSRRLSLGIWCPSIDEGDDEPVESFLVGKPGYYDFLDAAAS